MSTYFFVADFRGWNPPNPVHPGPYLLKLHTQVYGQEDTVVLGILETLYLLFSNKCAKLTKKSIHDVGSEVSGVAFQQIVGRVESL